MDERARSIIELIVAAGLGGGATGFWGWAQRRTSNRAENITGQAAMIAAAAKLQEVMNSAAENQVASLRNEIDGLRKDLAKVRAELRQEQQRCQSLENILRRNGYDLSAATEPGALTIIDPAAGTADVIRPTRRRRKP